jgi:N-acetylglutamate synthase
MERDLILDIERRSHRALPPAESVRLDGWILALGRGSVRRLNSCTTFGASSRRDLFERIEAVERRYAGRGRGARFRLTTLDRHLDDRLETRGYDRSGETIVMIGPVDGDHHDGVAVTRAAGPTWFVRYAAWGGHDDLRTDEIRESLGSLKLDLGAFTSDRAVGVAVVDPPWGGLFDVAVDPAARSEGHGRRLAESMLAWMGEHGATRSYLQVLASNTPATGLYTALGFREAYRYWYRTHP